MTLNRRQMGAFLAGAAALGLAGSARAQQHGKVVYFIPTLIDEFQSGSRDAFENVLGAMGYEVTSLDAQNRADLQLNQLEDAINTKPDAIIMNAVDFDAIVPGIEKARAAGIKVFNFDRLIRSTQFDLTSVAGTIEIGHLAAAKVIELLTAKNGSPKGKMLQILGDPGDNYTLDIQKGFEEVMDKQAPDVEIISKAAMQWTPENAGKVFEDQILVNPDIDLVFAHSGHLTVPIVSIMESKGKKPGDILMLASSGMPVALDHIRQGWQQAEVEQPTFAQVYGIAMFLPMILKGEKPQPGTYKVLGLDAVLTDEAWGPNLKIPGATIVKTNVDSPRFWGNMKIPTDPVEPVP